MWAVFFCCLHYLGRLYRLRFETCTPAVEWNDHDNYRCTDKNGCYKSLQVLQIWWLLLPSSVSPGDIAIVRLCTIDAKFCSSQGIIRKKFYDAQLKALTTFLNSAAPQLYRYHWDVAHDQVYKQTLHFVAKLFSWPMICWFLLNGEQGGESWSRDCNRIQMQCLHNNTVV
jgi:hypothetical protein